MLHVLSSDQKAQLVALGEEQVPSIQELAYKRFPLIKAFHRLLEGDLPPGSLSLIHI